MACRQRQRFNCTVTGSDRTVPGSDRGQDSRAHALQFTLYLLRTKIMAPKNKGKKGKNADDDAFWWVVRSGLILTL